MHKYALPFSPPAVELANQAEVLLASPVSDEEAADVLVAMANGDSALLGEAFAVKLARLAEVGLGAEALQDWSAQALAVAQAKAGS